MGAGRRELLVLIVMRSLQMLLVRVGGLFVEEVGEIGIGHDVGRSMYRDGVWNVECGMWSGSGRRRPGDQEVDFGLPCRARTGRAKLEGAGGP